jgi:hypothetical protein
MQNIILNIENVENYQNYAKKTDFGLIQNWQIWQNTSLSHVVYKNTISLQNTERKNVEKFLNYVPLDSTVILDTRRHLESEKILYEI